MRPGLAFFLVASAVGIPASVVALTDCQLQGECDPSFYWYDGQLTKTDATNIHEAVPDGSGLVDPMTWQSGPITGNWLDYPGERAMFLFPNVSGTFAGPYTSVTAWVSPDPDANDSNWTLASGNIAEITIHYVDGYAPYNWITVTNATCAPYYLRVVVSRAAPGDDGSDAGPASEDAATSFDADAGTDAASPLDAEAGSDAALNLDAAAAD